MTVHPTTLDTVSQRSFSANLLEALTHARRKKGTSAAGAAVTNMIFDISAVAYVEPALRRTDRNRGSVPLLSHVWKFYRVLSLSLSPFSSFFLLSSLPLSIPLLSLFPRALYSFQLDGIFPTARFSRLIANSKIIAALSPPLRAPRTVHKSGETIFNSMTWRDTKCSLCVAQCANARHNVKRDRQFSVLNHFHYKFARTCNFDSTNFR